MTRVFIRPKIQYRASSAILCHAGSDLGNTMHGHHDFQLGDDVLHKVHVGHYTFYSKAIVKNPKLMIRAPAVFAREYIKGEDKEGCKPLTPATGKCDGDYKNVIRIKRDDERPREVNSLIHGSNGSIPVDQYYVRGTHYAKGADGKITRRQINPLGFGEHTYPGCRYGREGRGVALQGVARTIQSMV